jgi:hypothetical protein
MKTSRPSPIEIDEYFFQGVDPDKCVTSLPFCWICARMFTASELIEHVCEFGGGAQYIRCAGCGQCSMAEVSIQALVTVRKPDIRDT